jgi:hypothetical protein
MALGLKMKLTNKVILIFVILGLLLSISPDWTASCTCVGRPPPVEAMFDSDYVLAGIVIGSEAPGPTLGVVAGDTTWYVSSADQLRWRFHVTAVWKGTIEDTVEIYSARLTGACGFEFGVGEHYLVYGDVIDAKPDPITNWATAAWPVGTLFPARHTSSCTRTQVYQKASYDISELPAPLWTETGN